MLEATRQWLAQKLNPAQSAIAGLEGDEIDSSSLDGSDRDFSTAYEDIEVVRRGVDMICNGVNAFNYDIAEPINGITPIRVGMRKAKLHRLLNYEVNPFYDRGKFFTNCTLDFILEGNIFIYFDGSFLYHLPSVNVKIETDSKTFIKRYVFEADGKKIEYTPDEIIHVQEGNSKSIYRGSSRLLAARKSVAAMQKMVEFQDSFFKNGAIPGLVLEADHPIPDKVKDRLLVSWASKYNPKNGGKRPLILDNGLKLKPISQTNFQELDFKESLNQKAEHILHVLGIPPILLAGGNNANISPNLRLFYLETVLPIVRLMAAAFERYFGYDIKPVSVGVSALQPDLIESSQYLTTLVNGGVITPNEAREELRYPKSTDEGSDELRIPANIAGSASNPSEGGRPPKK